ncbi:MAG: amino acid--tRNA ligase-related protein [Candidatus Hodgkinia cicadicola]
MAGQVRTGDVVNAKGMLYKDKLGNISLLVYSLTLVARFSRNLKYMKLTNAAGNAKHLLKRAAVVAELRRLLVGRSYIEVETPVLQALDLTNTNVKPFVTRYEWRKKLMQLRISPEFWLKNFMSFDPRLGIFEFAKSFRNEGGSVFHLIEFSLLEMYCLDLNFESGLKWIIEIINHLTRLFLGYSVSYRLISFCEVIRETTGYRIEQIDFSRALKVFNFLKLLGTTNSLIQLLNAAFDYAIKRTHGICYVLWFPIEDSRFSSSKWHNSKFAMRFETYWDGLELINASVELNDPAIQYKRCSGSVNPVLSECLARGLKPIFGAGFGVDRLCLKLFSLKNVSSASCCPNFKF